MITEFNFEDMVWYSVQFLGDLAAFLVSTPVIWFVALGLLFYVVQVVKRMVS